MGKNMKIWIATGGTGGHVFPAISAALELSLLGHKIRISSDGRALKMVRRDAPVGAKISFVWAGGVGGKSRIKQMIALFKIAVSSAALIMRFMIFRPNRVVAFGGYASVPAVIAGKFWRIPTLLHEQNAAIGRANLFSARFVKTLLISFPKVNGLPNNNNINIVYTGLPVRADFISHQNEALHLNSKILITGGSLGAQILDDVVPPAILEMKNKKIFITHQTRPENVAKLQKFYASVGIRANVLSFINDMAGAVADADLIIGRSGASTVAELQTIGRPAILVPLGINPDQVANAISFEKQGAAIVIPQNDFTIKHLTFVLNDLFDNTARLVKMSACAFVKNTAAKKIADEIIK